MVTECTIGGNKGLEAISIQFLLFTTGLIPVVNLVVHGLVCLSVYPSGPSNRW